MTSIKPMNPRAKELLVRALTSGFYEQCRGSLRSTRRHTRLEFRHCCLGVVTDLFINEMNDLERFRWLRDFPDSPSSTSFVLSSNPDEILLSDHAAKWAGLEVGPGNILLIDGLEATMARHNDGYNEGDQPYCRPKSFLEIANAIKEQL